MSDPEGFLTRWSRLKREAEEPAPDASADSPPGKEPAASDDTAISSAPPAKESEAPVVDLTTLPPLESIVAGTDIRAFLARGVPVELTRAALRRAWAADPAIRDFVGLAENAWDFNAPDGAPGFGPLAPSDDVRRLLAQITEEQSPPQALPSSPNPPRPELSQNPSVRDSTNGTAVREPGGEAPAQENGDRSTAKETDFAAAAEQEDVRQIQPATPTPPARGRALPR